MVDPGLRKFSLALDLDPGQRGSGNVEDPAVVDRFVAYVSPEDDQVRFGIGQGMPVPLSSGHQIRSRHLERHQRQG